MIKLNEKILAFLLVLGILVSSYTIECNGMQERKNTVPFYEVLDRPIIINLKRHTHRFEVTYKNMTEAGFTNIERFEAIDGYSTPQEFFDLLNVHGGTAGEKGCVASHLTIWKEFFESMDPREYLFICEDDMLPHSRFYELFQMYWAETPEDFDIILAGHNLFKAIDKTRPPNSLLVKIPSRSTIGYVISKKGAEKLYNLYMKLPSHLKRKKLTPFIIDVFIESLMLENKINYYCYDGRKFPDVENKKKNLISHRSCTGICFQHRHLGTTLKGEEVVDVP